jgi:hypothetical protein
MKGTLFFVDKKAKSTYPRDQISDILSIIFSLKYSGGLYGSVPTCYTDINR